MTTKEIAGKFVAYFHIPFTEDDVRYIEDALKTIIRTLGVEDVLTAVRTTMEEVPVHMLSSSNFTGGCTRYYGTTQIAIVTLDVNVPPHRFNRETGHIKKLTKLFFKVEHMAGFSSSIVAERMQDEGLYDLEHTNVESYEVWASTDAKQKSYRCRTWYPYSKHSHFFYDTRLCHAGIIEGITNYIVDVLEDFGWVIPSSYRIDSCIAAEDIAKDYKLGGTRDGKKKKEIKQ